jgi:branched-chain amino acid transport system substrate-binding protein
VQAEADIQHAPTWGDIMEGITPKRASRRSVLKSSASVAAALGAPVFIRPARAVEPVRIGSLADLSGPSSTDSGPISIYSAQLAIEDFGGQVLGRPIELLTIDDQNNPDVGIGAARKWLDDAGASAIISNTLSSIAISIKKLCEDRKKVLLLSITGSSIFSQEECSPMMTIFGVNSYCMPKGVVTALLNQGLDTWFFITADYTFGHSLERDATNFVRQGGGRVLGSVSFPTHSTEYSSYLLQAQASGAKAIGLAVQGTDFENLVKQASEFQLNKAGATIAGLFVLDNQIIGAGLGNTAGMMASGPFYWNMNENTRAFARRIMQRSGGVPPNNVQAVPYSAVMHYLRAVDAAGTLDGPAVVAKMKEMPINDFWSQNVRIREDGQALRPMYLMQVKSPAASTSRYDIYDIRGEVSPSAAWKPLSESACPLIFRK